MRGLDERQERPWIRKGNRPKPTNNSPNQKGWAENGRVLVRSSGCRSLTRQKVPALDLLVALGGQKLSQNLTSEFLPSHGRGQVGDVEFEFGGGLGALGLGDQMVGKGGYFGNVNLWKSLALVVVTVAAVIDTHPPSVDQEHKRWEASRMDR